MLITDLLKKEREQSQVASVLLQKHLYKYSVRILLKTYWLVFEIQDPLVGIGNLEITAGISTG
jgi:hypothetical protein